MRENLDERGELLDEDKKVYGKSMASTRITPGDYMENKLRYDQEINHIKQ